MGWLTALGVAWVVVGAVTSVVMIRRGHEVATWVVLGLVLGPASAIAAVGAVRAEARVRPEVLDAGRESAGDIDLVAGIDGSPESVAALHAAIALHRGALGRLAVATVIPHDADLDADVAATLARTVAALQPLHPATVVLRGEPVAALSRYAQEHGFELLVVGARGHGRAASPLGSVATRLASGAPVPVLVGPGRRPAG